MRQFGNLLPVMLMAEIFSRSDCLAALLAILVAVRLDWSKFM